MTGLVAPGARLIDATTGTVLAGADLDARVAGAVAAYQAVPPGAVFAANLNRTYCSDTSSHSRARG